MLNQIATLLVDVVGGLLVFLLLARFLFQCLRVPFRNPPGEFVLAATNWMVIPARRIVPAFAGLDLATLVLAWLIQGFALCLLYTLRGWDFGAAPGTAAAGVALVAAFDIVRYGLYFLVFAVVVQAVLSWVSPYSLVAPVFDALTRPFLRPIRRFVPLLANVDLSPLVLFVLLQVLLIALAHLRALAGSLI